MITNLNTYKNLITESKGDALDLIIVDVIEDYKKYFGESYLMDLEEYCEDFKRVFQIYEQDLIVDYVFPNQTLTIDKTYKKELDIEDIDFYFTNEIVKDTLYQKFNVTGFDERDTFETVHGDYWIYIDQVNKWFFCKKQMADLFKSFSKQGRDITLVGRNLNTDLRNIFVTLLAFNVKVQYNLEFVYTEHGSKYQKLNNI